MRKVAIYLAAVFMLALSGPAAADLVKVETQNQFVSLVSGKTLKRPLISLTVTPDGRIEGRGLRWDVEGNWTWRDGYFCRDLFWGGDALGYNCQEVLVNGDTIRFTSDRGNGDSADFRLN